jgi:hypothetical protein
MSNGGYVASFRTKVVNMIGQLARDNVCLQTLINAWFTPLERYQSVEHHEECIHRFCTVEPIKMLFNASKWLWKVRDTNFQNWDLLLVVELDYIIGSEVFVFSRVYTP